MKPTLFLLMGLPGAGKTTASKIICELTSAKHLWADHIRRQIHNPPTYTFKENTELYDHLNDVTQKLLREGKSVVFDTNFNFYKDRRHLREIALKSNARVILLWVQTPLEIAKKRAVNEAHLHETRILGAMPEEKFTHISKNLEEPHENEKYLELDGTRLNKAYVANQLKNYGNH